MKAVTCVILAVSLALFAMAAQATWPVSFYVDSEMVVELQAAAGFSGPIKMAGRSGASGDDERSGLYDNLTVYYDWDAHSYAIEEFFDVLDPSLWGLYGGSSPRLLLDFGNPAPCLMTSGDSLYASGLYSFESMSLGQSWIDQWWFGVDVYVGSTAEFHTVEFGIADADAPSGPPGQQVLGHVVGVTWTTNPQGVSVLQCVTDIDYAEVPAAAWAGGWHRIGFGGPGFSPVEPSSWSRVKMMFR